MTRASDLRDRRTFLAMAAALAVPAHARQVGGDSTTSIADLLVRFRRAYERLDVSQLERLVARNIRFVDPTFSLSATGIEEMKQLVADAVENIAAITISVENEIICPPWAVVQQEQTVLTRTSTARRIVVKGVSVFRIGDSRIREWHDYFDFAGYQRQLGAAQPEARQR